VNRRDLVVLVWAAMLSPRVIGAQPTERIRRIGYLTGATGAPEDLLGVSETRALVEGLREFGWADGRNITIEYRFSGSGRERIRANAKELAALNPAAIVSVGGPALAALLAETRTIPIVFTHLSDPIGSGFVANLARPGGNITGFAAQEGPIAGKWLELLKQIAPPIARALVIMEADSRPQLLLGNAVEAAAPSLGVALVTAAVRDLSDCEREMAAFAREPGGGLVVLPNVIANNNQERIQALAAHYQLPAVYSYPIFARTGGLISYGSDPVAEFHEAAGYIDRILRGAKPGDLPIQLPTRFPLIINLKTAKALGLTVPESLLARADEVIE
jgi:putative tryptophan/tyrosine transport system substrate-binding protein